MALARHNSLPLTNGRIEVVQSKGLRNILQMKTTYAGRNNSSSYISRRANGHTKNETPFEKEPKQFRPFVVRYPNSRTERIARLSKMGSKSPVRHIAFGRDRETYWYPGTPLIEELKDQDTKG